MEGRKVMDNSKPRLKRKQSKQQCKMDLMEAYLGKITPII
jgi:hypothetical protein